MKLPQFYVEKPWGRTDLPPAFADAAGRRIGEVWYDSPGQPLPLLIKWLFTSEKLSIQVHPSDAEAEARGLASGKEECWVIVSAEPDARLGIGTLEPLDADALRAASLNGDIERLMDWKPVKAGDYFYIPAGTVHAIGAGVTLVEVQQNADITYRLYDYGRPRELHLDDGVAVSAARPYADARAGGLSGETVQTLVDGPHFTLWHVQGDAVQTFANRGQRLWVTPLAGQVMCGEDVGRPGDCLLIEPGATLSADADARVLIAACDR